MRAESDQDLASTVRDHKCRHSKTKIAVFGEKCNAGQIVSYLGAGVDGFIDDSMNVEVLVKSLDLVMLHQKVVPTWFVEQLCPRKFGAVELSFDQSLNVAIPPPSCVVDGDEEIAHRTFSAREKDVLTCLMRGETNKNIARHLDMAEATVKVHVKAILRRVSAKNRTQAALWATKHGWPLGDTGSDKGQ